MKFNTELELNTINKSQILFRNNQAVIEKEADKRFMNLVKSQEQEFGKTLV